MKNVLLKGIGKNVVKRQLAVLPSHPPATWEPQRVWKEAAHRKCIERRYKRLTAYLNSVLVSPYQLALSLQDAFGNSKKGVPAAC